jgi:hypothetical protein
MNNLEPIIGDRIEYEFSGDIPDDLKGKRIGIIVDYGNAPRTHALTFIVRTETVPQGTLHVYPHEVLRVMERRNPDGTVTRD